MADRLRVLLLAEACNPTWASVPLVGYNFARALADRDDLDITLVSHIKNTAALKADSIAKRVQLHLIDNEWLARPMYKLATLLRGGEKLAWTVNTALAWPSYIAFEQQVYRKLHRELRSRRFDLIHRITPLSPTLPSPLAGWTDVPMLLGPLNGGLPWPRQFPDLAKQEREWLAPFRSAYKALPYYRSTYRHVKGIIAGSRHTATEAPRTSKAMRFYLPENGVDPERFEIAAGWTPPAGRFRFITVGRMVPYKGLMLTLNAFAQSAALRETELRIIGDGPQKPEVEAFIRTHQLSDRVTILDWMPQPQVAAELRAAQAFVFPSLREFGGGVVLEAMASGLPCIVVNYGGPGELLTSEGGELLPLTPRDQLIANLRGAMERLAGDLERCRTCGVAAVERIRRDFTWKSKAERIVDIYAAMRAAAN